MDIFFWREVPWTICDIPVMITKILKTESFGFYFNKSRPTTVAS